MSTLTVSNVSDGSISIPTTYVTNGSAKAWVNFNGTGTIAARDSLNVSSLTDNGTGDYTANFTNAFGAVDFNATGGNGNANNNGSDFGLPWISAPTVSTIRMGCFNGSQSSTTDNEYVSISCLGDLA